MKLFQGMQLIQKLRDDQKRMKKAFEDVSGSYEQKSNQDRDHRLDEVLSWLLVGGYREVNVVLMKAIALLRLAIGSSVKRNKEASFDCCEARGLLEDISSLKRSKYKCLYSLEQVTRKEKTKAKNAKKYAAHFTMYAALPIEFKN
ncbi:hypothetical protein Tco_0624279 [Tanacetum coccineum]|uniref:Uncharacterized protein n=1 Tax=Tanacetum coccineum TaxID=301880 RepID=A0ABQ4WDI1_9ASTR